MRRPVLSALARAAVVVVARAEAACNRGASGLYYASWRLRLVTSASSSVIRAPGMPAALAAVTACSAARTADLGSAADAGGAGAYDDHIQPRPCDRLVAHPSVRLGGRAGRLGPDAVVRVDGGVERGPSSSSWTWYGATSPGGHSGSR